MTTTHEDALDKLDSEFDHYLVDMKPFVLKLPHKTDRQRCALWIKKLCEPGMCGSGLTGHKNRNAYTRLLLYMLRRGVLEGPFTQRPPAGSLKTLPTYMSIYFDEPLCGHSVEQSTAGLPDWVTGELGRGDETWASMLTESPVTSPPSAQPGSTQRRRQCGGRSPSVLLASSPLRRSSKEAPQMVDGHAKPSTCPDDSDLEVRLNSWNLGIENPRYLREKPIPLSPIDMKTKVLEAKHQEEKLKMQQKHDADVQKILDRKNGELQELKSLYRTKQKESEETNRKLEKKVQSVVRESQIIRERKEMQIAELQKLSDQSADSLKNEWEKKLHAALSTMEKEKFELQKKHTESIQELLEDTNRRLAKMEAEYSSQSHAMEKTVRELELRVKQLTAEVESGVALRQKVGQEKAQLELHMAGISAELQEANRRNTLVLKEMEQQRDLGEQTVQKLQTKHEADMSHFQKEHALSAAKASEVIEELETTVGQLRQQSQESDLRRQKQLREQESKLQQDKAELQIHCDKKVLHLHIEAERERAEAKKRIVKLEDSLREVQAQLERARESQRQQSQEADIVLEQFRKQVELTAEETYADMKLQMEKVEEDLSRSKSLREKQAKEFSLQLEELKQRYEQQMAEQRVQQEQERTRQQQQQSADRDSLLHEHQRVVDSLERQARTALQQHQQNAQEWRKRDAQALSELEAQAAALRLELQAAHAQRKEQLAEADALRDEERQRAAQDNEASLGRLRAEMERVHADLERSHQLEREQTQEKASSRWKQLEKEYGQKLAKSAQLIAELQTSMCDAKEEDLRLHQALERQLEEANNRWDQERRSLSRHSDHAAKALQEQVEGLQKQLHSAEKRLLSKELESQEMVTAARQECELKMKGLMPAALRQELEDTINSLKSQVNFLQKRASVLQEDLDACRSRR